MTATRVATPPVNTTVGDRDLCAWQPVRGVTWVQTRNPRHTRRLKQRKDGRLVAVGVDGGYLRTFEFLQPLSWAVRLMNRYTRNDMATNAGLDSPDCPQNDEEQRPIGGQRILSPTRPAANGVSKPPISDRRSLLLPPRGWR